MEDDDNHKPFPVTIRAAVPIDPNKVTPAMDLPSRKSSPPNVSDGFFIPPDIEFSARHGDLPDPVKNERLAEDEIRRLNEQRENNTRKKMGRPPGSKNKPKAEAPKRPKRDRHKTGETAPNRPLELKSRLSAVLHITTQLARPELALFHDIMLRLERTSKGARKRIIAALGQVYP